MTVRKKKLAKESFSAPHQDFSNPRAGFASNNHRATTDPQCPNCPRCRRRWRRREETNPTLWTRIAEMPRNYEDQAQEPRSLTGLQQEEPRPINLTVQEGPQTNEKVVNVDCRSAKNRLLPRSSKGSYRPFWIGEDPWPCAKAFCQRPSNRQKRYWR